jgi:hypothetical protein
MESQMKLLYQCEVCSHVWPSEELAVYCENYKLDLPKFKPGDKVFFGTRYDGIESDTVISCSIQGTYLGEVVSSSDFDINYIKENVPLHTWFYTLSDSHQTGKDYYTNQIEEEYLFLTEQDAIVATSY